MPLSPPIQLSLCMIVKDEAGMLPEFLARARGLWDELVVVDTGSQDDTVAILEAAGAKVLHRPWQNDFALARNFSLEAASGEWVLVLDPDEHVCPEFVIQARALLADPQIGAATVAMQNHREDGHLQEEHILRMFRLHHEVRFRHAIHEDLTDTLLPRLRQTGQKIVHIDAPITHHGYERTHANGRGKKERDVSIIEVTLARDPDDLYLHYKLLEQARFWGDEALARRASPEAMAAFQRAPESALGHWAGELAVMMVDGLGLMSAQESLSTLQIISARLPQSPAIAYRLGELFETLHQYDEARLAFNGAQKMQGEAINKQLKTIRPLMGLVRVALATNEMGAALENLRMAHQLAPDDPEVAFAVRMMPG
jgi:tetratricopeptide (TPR) repeat protein